MVKRPSFFRKKDKGSMQPQMEYIIRRLTRIIEKILDDNTLYLSKRKISNDYEDTVAKEFIDFIDGWDIASEENNLLVVNDRVFAIKRLINFEYPDVKDERLLTIILLSFIIKNSPLLNYIIMSVLQNNKYLSPSLIDKGIIGNTNQTKWMKTWLSDLLIIDGEVLKNGIIIEITLHLLILEILEKVLTEKTGVISSRDVLKRLKNIELLEYYGSRVIENAVAHSKQYKIVERQNNFFYIGVER